MYVVKSLYFNKLRNVNFSSAHSNTSSNKIFTPPLTTTSISTLSYQSKPSSSFSSYSASTCSTYPPNIDQQYLNTNIPVSKHISSENYHHRIEEKIF